jgi:predicted porin
MIKKILPAMVGAVLAGGMTAVAADVSVFGHIDTSIDRLDVTDGAFSDKDINLHCTTCSIGFKGSEDLGNGLKAIFSLDFQYNTTERNADKSSPSGSQNDTFGNESPADAITDRDQWLGLSGGFGQVRIGTISTLYKSHGAMIDPLYRTALQGRDHHLQSDEFHNGAGEETRGRATNTIRYDSPSYSGFKVGVTYTLDNDKTDGEDDNPYGLGASYENGGILAFVDYITNNGSSTNPSGDISAWKVGGKYSFSDFAVMGQYEDGSEDNTNSDLTLWHIAGSYTMGSNMLYAAYGNRQVDIASTNVEDTDSWTIAGVHNLSKNTSAYLGYNSMNDDATGSNFEADQISLGMKMKF